MEFTKGEWKATQSPESKLWHVEANQQYICTLPPLSEANARLISSAPELYEACQRVVEDYKNAKRGQVIYEDHWTWAVNQLAIALAKAEGKE